MSTRDSDGKVRQRSGGGDGFSHARELMLEIFRDGRKSKYDGSGDTRQFTDPVMWMPWEMEEAANAGWWRVDSRSWNGLRLRS